MNAASKRIAINTGGEYVPGLNAVVAGAVLAAHELGWEVVGIRDGYEGLLFRDRYQDGGLAALTPQAMEGQAEAMGPMLGTSRVNPFAVRAVGTVQDIEVVAEADHSDELLAALQSERIDGVISVAGRRSLSVAWKLERKGLRTVCVPKAPQNDVAATSLSFGFNSAVSFSVELLDRIRTAARAAHRVAVVEVLGEYSGWLALHAGIAAYADAVLIPEIPYDLGKVVAQAKRGGRRPALVVVAEGARPAGAPASAGGSAREGLRRALSPGSADADVRRVIERSGAASESVALELQRRSNQETFPLALDQLLRGGRPTATDRQLGLAYGAAAVRAFQEGKSGVMVAFHPPKIEFVPLADAVNTTRTVPLDGESILAARSLGIALGD